MPSCAACCVHLAAAAIVPSSAWLCRSSGSLPIAGSPAPAPTSRGSRWYSFHSSQTLARALGEQVLAREAHVDSESLRAFADQHHVSGVLHHRLGSKRNVLDVAHSADRAGASGGSMHAAGIEFDDALLVGQPAESDTVVVGIVFRPADHRMRAIERIAPLAQDL